MLSLCHQHATLPVAAFETMHHEVLCSTTVEASVLMVVVAMQKDEGLPRRVVVDMLKSSCLSTI